MSRIPGALMTQGSTKDYLKKTKIDRRQISNIRKEIKENYISMLQANKFGIKKDIVTLAVKDDKIRTKLFRGKTFYHKEDIANLL